MLREKERERGKNEVRREGEEITRTRGQKDTERQIERLKTARPLYQT